MAKTDVGSEREDMNRIFSAKRQCAQIFKKSELSLDEIWTVTADLKEAAEAMMDGAVDIDGKAAWFHSLMESFLAGSAAASIIIMLFILALR